MFRKAKLKTTVANRDTGHDDCMSEPAFPITESMQPEAPKTMSVGGSLDTLPICQFLWE